MSQPYAAQETPAFLSLWDTQSGLCALCGKAMLRSRFEAPHGRVWAKWRATFDHIVPHAKGGKDGPENLQLAHARCNKIKGGEYPSTGSG